MWYLDKTLFPKAVYLLKAPLPGSTSNIKTITLNQIVPQMVYYMVHLLCSILYSNGQIVLLSRNMNEKN